LKLMQADAVKKSPLTLADTAYWLPDGVPSDWLNAFKAADGGDSGPLAALLRSERSLDRASRHFLADLVARRIGSHPGRRSTATYDRSDANIILDLALEQLRDLLKANAKLTVKQAAAEVAPNFDDLKVNTLVNAHWRTSAK
jgi:hypothetical protein